MPIEAQLGAPWRIAAHLQKQRPEIRIVNVEVVVVHVDGLVARALKLSVDFPALKCLRLLLGHSHEYDPVANAPSLPHPVCDFVLSLLLVELIERNLGFSIPP